MPCVPDLPKLIGGSNILAPENNHMKSDEKFDGLNFAISLFIYPRISLERKQIFWKFMNVSLRSQIVMVKNGNIMPKFPIGGKFFFVMLPKRHSVKIYSSAGSLTSVCYQVTSPDVVAFSLLLVGLNISLDHFCNHHIIRSSDHIGHIRLVHFGWSYYSI